LKADLLKAVEPETAGSPTGESMKWVRRSLRTLAGQLAQRACPSVLRRLLRSAGYGLRANHKRLSGQSPPDRDRQFRYLGRLRHLALSKGCPVLSIDTKNKELVGNFANDGATWCAEAEEVNAHDFPQDAECRAVPYGMYDVGRNRGHVCVGRSADTSQFAVNCLRNWWRTAEATYTGCRHLLLLADGGGSNSSRGRLWKRELQEFATETGLTITVCHYPPGTSKWNWIEHRLFSFISLNWAGEPLRTLRKLLSLIRGTTTKTGLEVTAALDPRDYPKKVKVPNAEFKSIQLQRHNICPQWNYSITPMNSRK
jgi:hypothetical protein